MRKTCLDMVYELAKKDPRIVFVGSDLGIGTLKQFKAEMPDRFLMEGVSEANIVGLAAGLALEGKIVYVNTIATFLTRRCFEQVALDLCLHKANVRLIGSGGGVVYAPLGPTHEAIEDIAIFRALPRMTIIAVADAEEMRRMMPETVDHSGPIYIRLAKGGDPVVTNDRVPFKINKAIPMKQGRDALIVSTGVMLKAALDAAAALGAAGVETAVLHAPVVKPFDQETFLTMAEPAPVIVAVEEHTIIGGLGSTVAELLAEADFKTPKRFRRVGLPDAFPDQYGSQASLLKRYDVTAEKLVSLVQELSPGKSGSSPAYEITTPTSPASSGHSARKKIPYVDIAGQHAALKSELHAAFERVLNHGHFILAEEVEEFDCRFAGLCRSPFAVGLNSGTDALILSLRALGIGPGDEVITAPNSFIASVGCIVLVGAKPVLVDVRGDYNLDPALLEKVVTPRTKAIIPVHLTGRPADMGPIMEIARRHRLKVIEDAAQAITAEYKGQRVGTFGDAGCFSLHPVKTFNACGDGGVVVTPHREVAEKIQLMRNLGLRTRENAVLWSSNSRLDALQAALLQVKFKYLDEWTEKRRANARFYQAALKDQTGVQVPVDAPHERAVYHTFVIQADRRDQLKEFLAEQGIGTAVHYGIPIHLQDVGRELGYHQGDFPVAERQAGRILSLPVYPELSPDDLTRVVEAIRRFYRS